MSNKIKEILNWYNNFDNTDIVIKSDKNNFHLNINNRQLPHLLGLHYASSTRLKGRELYNFVKYRSDEEIYELINKNNKKEFNDVRERIDNFKFFMENLEKAEIFEQTLSNSKLKSEFFIVKVNENKYLQLGIARDREETDYIETFIVRKDDLYIKNSNIKEKIISIEKYVDDELVPFSFDKKKELKLLLNYYENKEKNLTKEQSETIKKDVVSDIFYKKEENNLYNNIPEELKNERRWVVIKIVEASKQEKNKILNDVNLSDEEKEKQLSKLKPRKIPIQIDGTPASSTDEKTWSTFFEVENYINNNKKDNLVPTFALGDGYIGIDIDNVTNDIYDYYIDNSTDNVVADFLRNIDTYAEISPSKTGVHLIGKGKLPGEFKRKDNVEIYDNSRFFTVTGDIIKDKQRTEIKDINETLKPLYNKYIMKDRNINKNRKLEYIKTTQTDMQILKNVFRLDKLNNFKKEDLENIYYLGNWENYEKFKSNSEADYYMASRIMYYASGDIDTTKKLMLNSGLYREKWDNLRGESTYLDKLLETVYINTKTFYKQKEILDTDKKFFVEEIRKNNEFHIDNTKNYNYVSNNQYKEFNNFKLNMYRKQYKYDSNIWITSNQIMNKNKEKSITNDKQLIIKNNEEFCKINMPFFKEGSVVYNEITLYNADNIINIDKNYIKEEEKRPIKTVEEIVCDCSELESSFIKILLDDREKISKEILNNYSDEEIINSFKKASSKVNNIEFEIVEKVENKEQSNLKEKEIKNISYDIER